MYIINFENKEIAFSFSSVTVNSLKLVSKEGISSFKLVLASWDIVNITWWLGEFNDVNWDSNWTFFSVRKSLYCFKIDLTGYNARNDSEDREIIICVCKGNILYIGITHNEV